MIDHTGIVVAESELDAVVAFYLTALAPLGYKEMFRFPGRNGGTVVGMGADNTPDWWISAIAEKPGQAMKTHVAFSSSDRDKVGAFHTAALAAGGKDNGPPGLRTEYTPTYYAAFALDPAGNNVEVVCHCDPAAA